MAVPTDPSDLQSVSACYCFDADTATRVKIYLLANIAGLEDLTPSQLAEAAQCYCFSHETAKRVLTYLLCQAVNAI